MKIRISRLEREERVGVEARMSSRLAVRSWSSRKCTYVVVCVCCICCVNRVFEVWIAFN
jgi:hypothetical protein